MVQKITNMLIEALFLVVVPAAGFNFVNNPSCMQNCSWVSHNSDGDPVENGCAFNISREDIANFPSCPNTQPGVEDYSIARISEVHFYQIPSPGSIPSGNEEQNTTMCVNITFTIDRGGASHLKGIRITALSTSYYDINSILCQVWNFTTPVDQCSFSNGRCSVDIGGERHFYYDCFCGFGPGGLLKISVDTLPKTSRQRQLFEEFAIPRCGSDHPAIQNNEYCYLPPKEKWYPHHATSTQSCGDYNTVNVTFDLVDWSLGVQSYFVFLYIASPTECRVINGNYIAEQVVNVSTAVVTEKLIDHKPFNFTTVTFTGVDPDHYMAGFKIKEPNMYLQKICGTWLGVKGDPCKSNPCSRRAVCQVECLNFTCDCYQDYQRIRSECQDPWKPTSYQHYVFYNRSVVVSFRRAAPENYGVTNYSIVLTNNSTGKRMEAYNILVDADRYINGTFDALIPDQYYTPAVRISEEDCPECEYLSFEPFKFSPQAEPSMWTSMMSGVFGALLLALITLGAVVKWRKSQSNRGDQLIPDEVPLPESPSRPRHDLPTGVRLVCNKGLQLQKFTASLRQLIQEHVQCTVTIHTISDASQVLGSHWLSEARANQEAICFLWDENLSILAHRSPNGTPGHGLDRTVCEVVGSLSNCDLDLGVILVFDFARATCLPECPRFKLPSELLGFLKKLDPLVNVLEVETTEVDMAYAELKHIAGVNSYESSAAVWKTLYPGSENGGSEIQSVVTEDFSLEEEEANVPIIENCQHPEFQNGYAALV